MNMFLDTKFQNILILLKYYINIHVKYKFEILLFNYSQKYKIYRFKISLNNVINYQIYCGDYSRQQFFSVNIISKNYVYQIIIMKYLKITHVLIKLLVVFSIPDLYNVIKLLVLNIY